MVREKNPNLPETTEKSSFPTREIVMQRRMAFPTGTRVRLVHMEDEQAPPVGTLGTVIGVDDIGSLLMCWDNGSGLNAIYGEDVVSIED